MTFNFEEAKRKLAARRAEMDKVRGRPLTQAEMLDNLQRGLSEGDATPFLDELMRPKDRESLEAFTDRMLKE